MIKLMLFMVQLANATPDMSVTAGSTKPSAQPRGSWIQFSTTVMNKGDAIPVDGVITVNFNYAGFTYTKSRTGAIAICESVDVLSDPVFIPEANFSGQAGASVVPLTGETVINNNGPFKWSVSLPALPAFSEMKK